MGPVHLYLAAWFAGGLLLGASLLLDGRESPDAAPSSPSDEATSGEPGADSGPGTLPQLSQSSRFFRLCSLALIGFGLCGLTAKGFDLDLWPWTLVCALTAGVLLFALGYRLSRSASRSSV